jgi:hypothetical protein
MEDTEQVIESLVGKGYCPKRRAGDRGSELEREVPDVNITMTFEMYGTP